MSWSFRASIWCLPLGAWLAQASYATPVSFGANTPERAEVVTRVLDGRGDIPGVEVRLDLPALNVTRDANGFATIETPGMAPLDLAGTPDLPTAGALIAVPEGYTPVLEVEAAEQRIAGVTPRPTQRKWRCSTASNDGFEFNTVLYRSGNVFPESPVRIEEVGSLAGVRLARIGLYPIRADLAANALRVSPRIVARVYFEKTGTAAAVTVSREIASLLGAFTANAASLPRSAVDISDREHLLVLTADELKASLAPYVAWKEARGIDVKVVTQTEAGTTKEKIKSFIQSYYNGARPRPTYLLFVGNKDTMPVFMESTASGPAASDFRYALLAGTDEIPDVLYGRIPADSAADVEVQISRWLQYEKTPESGALWYPKATTIASNEGSNPSDKEYAQQVAGALKAFTYQHADGFYQGEQSATAANISTAAVEGRTWIAYFGHGSGTSWGSTNDAFNNQTVGTLTNSDRLPIVIDVACQNASWVKIPTCFGKAWVTQKSGGRNAGAVAFYGGSVNISWHPPAVMSVGVAKSHFEKPLHTLGGSVMGGQLYLLEKMGTTSATLDNVKWYNLFGDPTMLVRTATPKAYEVQHDVRKTNGRLEVVVKTIDASGAGVAGLTATLHRQAGTALATARTDSSGNAVLVVPGQTGLEPNTVLTTSGYNAEVREENLN